MLHVPVLLQSSIDSLALKSGDVFLDATLGGGGHSEAVARQFGDKVRIVAIDLDNETLRAASERVNKLSKNFSAFQGNFRNLDLILDHAGISEVNKILFDLGISSIQLDGSGRGFTFKKNEPLLMTMSDKIAGEEIASNEISGENDIEQDQVKFTAKDIVNTWTEEHLVDIIRGYGEERYAARIANAIVEARKIKPIATTFELVEIIEKAAPGSYRHGRIHPATRTFQAIRITVNDELGAIESGLKKGFERLVQGGRMAVISFHSLEDRIVKRYFKQLVLEEKAKAINKKPIVPSIEEKDENPRSRSAKLRVIEKI